MVKRFCPMVHAPCEDGFPDNKDLPCVFWDSIDQVCLYVQATIFTYESMRIWQEAKRRSAENNGMEH